MNKNDLILIVVFILISIFVIVRPFCVQNVWILFQDLTYPHSNTEEDFVCTILQANSCQIPLLSCIFHCLLYGRRCELYDGTLLVAIGLHRHLAGSAHPHIVVVVAGKDVSRQILTNKGVVADGACHRSRCQGSKVGW